MYLLAADVVEVGNGQLLLGHFMLLHGACILVYGQAQIMPGLCHCTGDLLYITWCQPFTI